MIVRVHGLITTGLVIAENMIITITQTLASTEFYINVTNNVLVTVSQSIGQWSLGALGAKGMDEASDDELMNIVNDMSTEDKAAVIKYAKSIVDDSEGGGKSQRSMRRCNLPGNLHTK